MIRPPHPSSLVATLFGLVYLALALGGVPGLRIDRAAIAMVGAAAMLGVGAIDLDEAARAVDPETIVLLLGMMVLVAYLRMAGFFALATDRVARRFGGPFALLGVIIGLSGVLSAFLVNDVVCVALTPLTLDLCRRLRRPPIPYLVGLATAANIGSVATITGNPQNMIIGSITDLGYARFAARLAPVAAIGLALDFALVAFLYRRTLRRPVDPRPAVEARSRPRPRVHRGLMARSLTATVVSIVLFFLGAPIATVALVAAAALMLDRVRPDRVYAAIDWPLLLMFAGLFVIVHAFDVRVVAAWDLGRLAGRFESPMALVTGLAVVLSNLVSNVPAVLLVKPLMAALPDQEQAWLALAMASTLAGNLTLLGSVANLIVAESARREGADLGFVEYLKVGVPLTAATVAAGFAWLSLVRY